MSKAQRTVYNNRVKNLTPERERFEVLMSAYVEEGMEQEDGVVSMEEALRINKILTQQKKKHV